MVMGVDKESIVEPFLLNKSNLYKINEFQS